MTRRWTQTDMRKVILIHNLNYKTNYILIHYSHKTVHFNRSFVFATFTQTLQRIEVFHEIHLFVKRKSYEV